MARGTSRIDDRPHARAREPQQARARRTQAKLIQTALDLIDKQGIERTSMAEIAQQAGVGTGTLYHHFPDKRALVLQLIEEWGERIEADRRSDLELKAWLTQDPRAALAQMLRGFYERLHDQNYLYAELSLLMYRDPGIRERCERLKHAGAERFAAIIEFGQERGVFRKEPAPDTAAFLMINAMELLTAHVLKLLRPKDETERVLGELTDMLSRYLLEDR